MLSRFNLQVQEFNVIIMNYESFGVTKNSNVPPLKTSPLPQTCTVSLDCSPTKVIRLTMMTAVMTHVL